MNDLYLNCVTNLFQKAFGIVLEVWDDDVGNFLGIGTASDLIDNIQYNVANLPAQKDFQSATARSITVRTM